MIWSWVWTKRRAAALFCLALAAAASSMLLLARADASQSRDGAPPAPSARMEPKADETLRRMSKTLAGAKSVRFRAHDMVDQVMENGQKLQFARTVTVVARRPGSVTATVKGDAEDMQFAYQDAKITIINHRDRCYAAHDVPPTIDAMFDFLAERYGVTAPLADLLFSDPYDAMTGRVRSGQYLGLHAVMDARCHHLAFRQDGIDWQIWIEDSDRPVPRKVVITYKELPSQPQFVALLDDWDISTDVPDSAFKLSAPAGYQRIDLQPIGQPTTAPTGR